MICDMMGIPRSEFHTVLDATNVILGAGDPECIGDRDVATAFFKAGMQLTRLMNELAEQRRADPTDDLTRSWCTATSARTCSPPTSSGRSSSSSPWPATTRPAPGSASGWTCCPRTPTSGGYGRTTSRASTACRGRGDRAGGVPVTYMRRTITHDLTLSEQEFAEGDKVVLFYGAANRDPREFDDPEGFDVRRDPNPHVGFGGPGPHFCLGAHLARRELAVMFRQLLTRLPDIEVIGEPEPLDGLGIPLVGGIKHLPVRFTPTAPVGA